MHRNITFLWSSFHRFREILNNLPFITSLSITIWWLEGKKSISKTAYLFRKMVTSENNKD